MNKEEMIKEIAALDPEVKTDGLRNKELEILLAGLKAPGQIQDLEDSIEELNEALEQSENQAKAQPGHKVVGKTEAGTVYMTIPAAYFEGSKITAKELAADSNLLKKLLAQNPSYLITK